MGKTHPEISEQLRQWIEAQKIFFVASAPLDGEAFVNCSPKGGDCFRVLGPLRVAYQDYTGSGIETLSHVRENGRMCLMFCGFEGPPKIVRLHGKATAHLPGEPQFEELAAHFPPNPGMRAIFEMWVERISDSCGFSVPFFDYKEPRTLLDDWAGRQGEDGLREYRRMKNGASINGLPGYPGQD